MARTTLSHPFDSMSGKLGSSDKIIMRTRNGRTHAYVVKHPYKGPVAPERQRTITAFADAVNQTTVILNTPELRLEWEEKFAAYRKKADRYPNTYPNPYTTLRGFIIGSLIHPQDHLDTQPSAQNPFCAEGFCSIIIETHL